MDKGSHFYRTDLQIHSKLRLRLPETDKMWENYDRTGG